MNPISQQARVTHEEQAAAEAVLVELRNLESVCGNSSPKQRLMPDLSNVGRAMEQLRSLYKQSLLPSEGAKYWRKVLQSQSRLRFSFPWQILFPDLLEGNPQNYARYEGTDTAYERFVDRLEMLRAWVEDWFNMPNHLQKPEPVIRLFGEKEPPLVFGKEKRRLTYRRWFVLKELLVAGETGLSKGELESKCHPKVMEPVSCLKGLKKVDEDWGRAIVLAEKPWKKYHILHE